MMYIYISSLCVIFCSVALACALEQACMLMLLFFSPCAVENDKSA